MLRNCSMLAVMLLLTIGSVLTLGGCDQTGAVLLTPGPQIQQLQIRNQPLPVGEEGVAYTGLVTAQGGVSPYTFTITGQGVPGLTMGSDGVLAGTPTTPGQFLVPVQVADSAAPPRTASLTFSIVITAPGGGSGGSTNSSPSFTTVPTTDAQLVTMTGSPYSFVFAATDPDGDQLLYDIAQQTANATAAQIDPLTGVFTFTPATNRIYCFGVTVEDGVNPPIMFSFALLANQSGTGNAPAQPARITSTPNQSAKQGTQYTYQPAVTFGAGTVQWSLAAAPAPGTLPGSTMVVNPGNGLIQWVPDASHVTPTGQPGHLVTLVADNGSCDPSEQSFFVVVSAGSLPPSSIRVVASGISGSNPSRSYDRTIGLVDPNLPGTVTGVPGLANVTFLNGSPRFAMTGQKHSLRLGAGLPHEVNLNTTTVYIQTPTYTAVPPTTSGSNTSASARLYHFTNTEDATNITGTVDAIFAVDTYGTVQTFAFGANIHEEIYVPSNFSSHPRFVVTAANGKRMWFCRIDRVAYTGGVTTTGNMLTVDLSGVLTANEEVMHQSVTLAGIDYWFGVRDTVTDACRLFRVPTDAGAGNDPVAVEVPVPGLGASGMMSSYFARSGNGNRIAFVGGDDMSAGINTPNAPVALAGLWRDIWVINGPARTVSRATNFELRRPAAGPNVRLIEVFESSSIDAHDFSANAANDDGGNDNRVIFGTTSTGGNSTHVGHTLNYDGSLVAFVVIETNEGSGDGSSDALRDEVYVAGVNTSGARSGHDVIRVTASPAAGAGSDQAGTRIATPAQNGFGVNMGTCTGLAFPLRGSSAGRDSRLFFAYGRNVGGSLNEYGQQLYSAEFTVNGTNDIQHVSTAHRQTGAPAAANGFEIANPADDKSMFLASYESGSSAGNQGFLFFVHLSGTTGGPASGDTAQLKYVDLTVANSAIVANGVGTLRPVLDAQGAPVNAYVLDSDRTVLGSGFRGTGPFGSSPPGSPVQVPVISDMFASIPGPASSSNIEGVGFFVGINGASENLYQFSLLDPAGNPAANITRLSSPGRIHRIHVAASGTSVSVIRGAVDAAFPEHRYSTSLNNCDIFVVPSVSAAYQAVIAGGGTPAVAMQVPAGTFVSSTVQWVDTTSLGLGGQTSFELWYAQGGSTQNGLLVESTMNMRRSGVNPAAGSVAASSEVNPGGNPGAVIFYGSGD
jgi:hypothetical protein